MEHLGLSRILQQLLRGQSTGSSSCYSHNGKFVKLRNKLCITFIPPGKMGRGKKLREGRRMDGGMKRRKREVGEEEKIREREGGRKGVRGREERTEKETEYKGNDLLPVTEVGSQQLSSGGQQLFLKLLPQLSDSWQSRYINSVAKLRLPLNTVGQA